MTNTKKKPTMPIEEKNEASFYSKINEIVKIQATMFSVIVLSFSIILNAISYHNRLLFDLAPTKDDIQSFVPYHEIMKLFTIFIGIGILSLVCGILAIYVNGKKQKVIGIASIIFFFLSLYIFGYTIYSYRLSFYFY